MIPLPKETREKLQKAAMHKLVPRCIRYYTKIPLTVAGKIRLSRYPKEALEQALADLDTNLAPKSAYKEIVSLAEGYCREHYRSFNDDAVKFLSGVFGIKESDASVRTQSTRPEYLPWEPPQKTESEPVYVSYFKLKEHLEAKRLAFPNPYQKKYRAYLDEALNSVDGVDQADIERELYRLYKKRRSENDICNQGHSNCAQASQNNVSNAARL